MTTTLSSHIYKGLAMAIMLLSSLCAFSQTDSIANSRSENSPIELQPIFDRHPLITHTTTWMFGAGHANVLDTYLSNYSYTGSDLRLQREGERHVSMFGREFDRVILLDIGGSLMTNHAGTTHAYAADLRHSIAWLRNVISLTNDNRSVALGPELSTHLGGVYINRTGNNPAQAKADITLGVAARAHCDFTLLHAPLRLTTTLSMPIAGAAFSPQYGQSYYETFLLHNYDHNVVFVNPINTPSLRTRIMLSMPTGHYGSRFHIGYAGQFHQSRYNNLRYHSFCHDIMIGYSFSLTAIPPLHL